MNIFQRERLACAYFFAFPGLCYGAFTSRLPALRELTGVNEAWIGFLLLAFGGASFIGLTGSNSIISRFGAKKVTGYAALLFTVSMIIAALALSYWQLLFFCLWGGFGIGLCDVAMNSAGVILERKHNRLSMGFLHASFSLGGLAGSLAGSLFSAFGFSPFINLLCTLGIYLPFWPIAYANMPDSEITHSNSRAAKLSNKPLFLYACAFICLLCFVSEGSVGEWGSLLLYTAKNASQQQAALVFAFFCSAMVIGRLSADSLRARLGDFTLVLSGALLGAIAMSLVLLSPWVWICLCAYFMMGLGFSSIVPIFFSRAGQIPNISAAGAISFVSLFAYGGLLVFPPLLGMLGKSIGLNKALWIIVILCCLVASGSVLVRRHETGKANNIGL